MRRLMILLPLVFAACQTGEVVKKPQSAATGTVAFARAIETGSGAGGLFRAGKFDEARKAAEADLAAARADASAGKEKKAGAMIMLGTIDCRLAKFKDADKLYTEAQSLLDESSDDDRVPLAAALNGVAELRYATADWHDAKDACRKALAIRRKALPADHPDLAQSLANFGVMLVADPDVKITQAMLNESHRDLLDALKIQKKSLGEDAPETADTFARLGIYFMELDVDDQEIFPEAADDLDRSTRCLNRALEIQRRSLPAGHADIAETLLSIAKLKLTSNDIDEAARNAIEARDMFEKALGKEHPDVGFALEVLGKARREKNRLLEAVAYFERAQTIFENAFGPDHYYVGKALEDLSDIYSETGDKVKVNLIKKRLDRIFGQAL